MPPKIDPEHESEEGLKILHEQVMAWCQAMDMWNHSSGWKPKPRFSDFEGKKPISDEDFAKKCYFGNEYDAEPESEPEEAEDEE